MDHESPDLIKREMQDTRQSLTEKVSALENQVVGTVQHAACAVQDTVETVTSAVKDTVTDIKSSLNIADQVRAHPWAVVAGAAGAGMIVGCLLTPSGRSALGMTQRSIAPSNRLASEPTFPTHSTKSPRFGGIFDELIETVKTELRRVGEEALGTLSGSLRHLVTNGIHSLVENGLANRFGSYQHDAEGEGDFRRTRHNGHASATA